MAPVIGYWPIRGLAQQIRYLLEFTGTKYEEKVYTKRDQWAQDKQSLGLDLPNLPYYFDGDLKITESGAIIKHLGRKHGLNGTTEDELIRIDVANGVLHDILTGYVMLCYNPNFETLKGAYINDIATPLGKLCKILGNRNFIAGNKVTYVDFTMFEILERIVFLVPNSLSNFKTLQDYHKRMSELPAMKKYLASPAFQKMKGHFNGSTAKFGAGVF